MICSRCVLDDGIPGIVFDERGVCNYCHYHDRLDQMSPVSQQRLFSLVDRMKEDGCGKEFDAVMGVSGGCDSSYLMTVLHNLGVRLLAVHMDNGWNTETAEHNMQVVTGKLGVLLERVKVDQSVFDSCCRSMLMASTPDADIVNDLCILEVVQQKAMEHGVRYVVNGHSFRTEGSAPLGWTYMDGGYLESVNERFERVDLSMFPHLCWDRQMEFIRFGIRNVRPMYHLMYDKEGAKRFLMNGFGWKWYHGLHAENVYTKFVGRYLWVRKFGIDYRKVEFAALVRSGFLGRDEALKRLGVSSVFEPEYLQRVKQRLGLSEDEFGRIMNLPIKSYRDYGSYLPLFRKYKDRFYQWMLEGKVSETFYLKYCEGV